ncbi:MAG: copper amine oxidase N-terminal domain-containing protein [Syntrophomonas sp.]
MRENGRAWYLCIILMLLLVIGGGSQAQAAGSASFTVGSTSYYVDGVAQNIEVAPYINNGRTYVPILYLAQAVGVQTKDVVWDAVNATITLSKGDQVIQMQVGNQNLLVNGATRQMDVAPEITSGRTFLPASFVAQGFGYSVDWDAASQTVKLYQGSSNPPLNNINPKAETELRTWEDWPAASTDDPNHTWTIVFKQAMDNSTINSFNIYVSPDLDGSRRIDGIGITATDSTHALVSPPTGGWKAETKYYLIITKKVLTSEGEPLKDFVRMPFSLTDTKVVLTPDYFVPADISKVYVVAFSSNSGYSDAKYTKWKGTKQYSYYGPDFDERNCTEEEYAIDGNELKWIGRTVYDNGNGHGSTCTSGSYVLIKPASVGEKWDINYVSTSNEGTSTWIAEGQFVGMENVTVMGSNMECAHIRIQGICQNGSSSKSYVDNYWLSRGIGVVKAIYEFYGNIGNDELIEIK